MKSQTEQACTDSIGFIGFQQLDRKFILKSWKKWFCFPSQLVHVVLRFRLGFLSNA